METGFRKWGWRWVCTISFLCLCAMPAVSQDCNGTYEKGLALLNKKTEANVKEAIRQFESAKRCYKVNRDQIGIQNCDEQIAACNQLLKSFTQRASKSVVSTEQTVLFSALGGTQMVPVETKRNWTFSGSHDWCSAVKDAEGLKLVADPNPSTVRRSQTVTVQWSGHKQLLKIVQEGSEIQLSLGERDVYFTADDGERTVAVQSNYAWTVQEESIPEWCTVRVDSTHLYLLPAYNDSGERREATIRLAAETKKETLRVVQDMDDFKVLTETGQDTVSFYRMGGKKEVSVEYTVRQQDQGWEVESYPNWCEAEKDGGNVLRLNCSRNKTKAVRSGVIRLKRGRRLISLVVTQSHKGETLKQALFGK